MIGDILIPLIENNDPPKLANLDFYMKLLDSRLSLKATHDDRIIGHKLDPRLAGFLVSLSRKMEGAEIGFLGIDELVQRSSKRLDATSVSDRTIVDAITPVLKEEIKPLEQRAKLMGDKEKSPLYKYYNSSVPIATLVSDLQYNLQGLDTANIKFTQNGITLNFLQTTPVKCMLKEILKCGHYYRHVVSKMNQRGLFSQALYSFIKNKLSGYQQLILKIINLKEPSLMVVQTLIYDWKLKLRWMCEMVHTDNIDLLSKIQFYCTHGNILINQLSSDCLAAVKVVFEGMVSKFIFDLDELADPFGEFFIKDNQLLRARIPSFISEETATQILKTGVNAKFTGINYKLVQLSSKDVTKLYELSSKDVVKKLISKGLETHLRNLAQYLLILDGNFIKTLHTNTNDIRNRYELSRILEDSLDGIMVDNLDISTTKDSSITLKYDLDPLFHLVVTEAQLVEYQVLFVKLYNLYKESFYLFEKWKLYTGI